MPRTFTQLHDRIVFSTRNREPTLTPQIRERVWENLGEAIRGEGGVSLRVGGVADHVHLLVSLPQTRSFAYSVRKLKTASSTWLHETMPPSNVWWHTGYGAIALSHSAIPAVIEYIERQFDHMGQLRQPASLVTTSLAGS